VEMPHSLAMHNYRPRYRGCDTSTSNTPNISVGAHSSNEKANPGQQVGPLSYIPPPGSLLDVVACGKEKKADEIYCTQPPSEL